MSSPSTAMPARVALGGDGSEIIGSLTPKNLVSFSRRLVTHVANWPEVFVRLGLASLNLKRGDICTSLRNGASIVAPPSRRAWWPTFEMFVEDVYHLGQLHGVRLSPGDVILDLGAHIGASAVLLSRQWPDATVVCYEPNPQSFGYLQENLRRNGVRNETHNEAIGSKDGSTTLFGVDDASCEASTSLEVPGSVLEVSVAGFERVIREAPGPVRIVKLDCEGAEHEVLAHSTPELWSDVEAILLEYHRTGDPKSEWPQVAARFHDLGFTTLWETAFPWYPGLGMAGFRRAPAGMV